MRRYARQAVVATPLPPFSCCTRLACVCGVNPNPPPPHSATPPPSGPQARLAAEAAAREQRKKDAAERIKAALFALGDCPDLGLDGFGDLLAAANALGNAVGRFDR